MLCDGWVTPPATCTDQKCSACSDFNLLTWKTLQVKSWWSRHAVRNNIISLIWQSHLDFLQTLKNYLCLLKTESTLSFSLGFWMMCWMSCGVHKYRWSMMFQRVCSCVLVWKGKEKNKANTHYVAPIDTQLSYRHTILCKYMQSQGRAEDKESQGDL